MRAWAPCPPRPGWSYDDPSAGDERLPAQGGRHPGLPVGALAPARPVDVHGAHRLVAPRRRRLRPPPGRRRDPHRAGGGACAAPRPGPRAPDPVAGRGGGRLAGGSRSGSARSASSVPSWACPTPWCCTGPRSRCRAACRWRRQALGAVLGRARLVICAGRYPAAEARRAAPSLSAPVVEVPPGVDLDRFRPLSDEERAKARAAWGLPAGGPLVVSISRLVPRKGMDVLIAAAAALEPSFPGLTVAIAGVGRDLGRLRGLVRSTGAPVRLPRPGRRRGSSPPLRGGRRVRHGLPQPVAGSRAGGIRDRLPGGGGGRGGPGGRAQRGGRRGRDRRGDGAGGGRSGRPRGRGPRPAPSCSVDDDRRRRMGRAARVRVEESFGYGFLARRLADALQDVEG